MRRIMIAVVLALSTLTLVAPAQAHSQGCVSQGEFAKVRVGMSQAQVARLFDTAGAQRTTAQPVARRVYRSCAPRYVVAVDFSGRKVVAAHRTWLGMPLWVLRDGRWVLAW